MINNDTLEMLSAREQLMEDIDCIITSQYLDDKIDEDDFEDLIRVLCDAVCKNFPTKWYSGQPPVDGWVSVTQNRHRPQNRVL